MSHDNNDTVQAGFNRFHVQAGEKIQLTVYMDWVYSSKLLMPSAILKHAPKRFNLGMACGCIYSVLTVILMQNRKIWCPYVCGLLKILLFKQNAKTGDYYQFKIPKKYEIKAIYLLHRQI